MSFSGDTKSTLAQETIDKNCCLTACLAGMLHFSPVTDGNVLTFKTESKEVSSFFSSLLVSTAEITAETKRVGSAYKTELSGENFEKIRENYVRLTEEISELLEEKQKRNTKLQQMEAAYTCEQAGMLAMDLESGSPCPVCGSVEHPDPAKPAEGAVTKEELGKRKQEYQKLSEEIENLGKQLH